MAAGGGMMPGYKVLGHKSLQEGGREGVQPWLGFRRT